MKHRALCSHPVEYVDTKVEDQAKESWGNSNGGMTSNFSRYSTFTPLLVQRRRPDRAVFHGVGAFYSTLYFRMSVLTKMWSNAARNRVSGAPTP